MEDVLKELPQWLREFSFERYYSDNYVVVDFETTILDKGSPYNLDNNIVCSSHRLGVGHPDYTPRTTVTQGNEYQQTELVSLIEKADFWIAHNAKFEYGWLERCGLPLNKSLAFCTQIAEYVLMSNRRGLLNLNACLKRRGMEGKEELGTRLLKASVCPSTWPERWLVPYSARDVDAGEALFLRQRATLKRLDKMKTAFTRNIFTPCLVSIEQIGIHLDKERVIKVHRDYVLKLRELQYEIDKLTGGANPASPKQMRVVLYEKLKFAYPTHKKHFTETGQPTTSYDKYLCTLKPKNKKQERFLSIKKEWGKVNAALTKCLNKFNDCVLETEDHILTASLNQTVTATQRLSSTGRNYKAQFQNFPRIFKPLFSARTEGWEIGEQDQAQLEYRVAVWFGQDAAGIYDIEHYIDSHSYTASTIFGSVFDALPKDSVERTDYRTQAKAHTFKPLFGGKSGTKAEVRYYEAFQAKHEGITHVQNEWKSEALETGKVSCPNGLEFYFPGTRMTNTGYIINSTQICNYNVQSLAGSDIVPVSITYQWYAMKALKLESFYVNTVHDSGVLEVKPEEKQIIFDLGELFGEKLVKQYMKEIYDIDFNVPLEIETKFSENWNDTPDWREQYLGELNE